MSKMNLPNKLTVLRLILVPVILAVGFLTPKNDGSLWFYISSAICALIFIAASITDMLDGKIARKYGLITDFGKFMDPVADKFMVIGALFVILYKFPALELFMMITLIVIVFRELAVTSMRLVVSTGSNIVVAANMLGKIKTVSQIVAIVAVLLEPVLQFAIFGHQFTWNNCNIVPLTWLSLAFALVMTVWSGINYIAAYWKYLDPEK